MVLLDSWAGDVGSRCVGASGDERLLLAPSIRPQRGGVGSTLDCPFQVCYITRGRTHMKPFPTTLFLGCRVSFMTCWAPHAYSHMAPHMVPVGLMHDGAHEAPLRGATWAPMWGIISASMRQICRMLAHVQTHPRWCLGSPFGKVFVLLLLCSVMLPHF